MKFVPRSENTRNLIIEATAELFNKKGYAGTSIADLEKATNLTKGSIYGNFENKEQVALAAFDYNLSAIRKKIGTVVAAAPTYKGKILAYLEAYNNLEVVNSGGCPLQNTAVEADDTHEELRKRAADGLLSFKGGIMELINKGIGAKEFKEDVNAETVALTFIALIEGAILISRATKDRSAMKIVLESARRNIEDICV